MSSSLSRADLIKSLPPLYSQENSTDPILHKRLYAPNSEWACYIAEGSAKPHDVILFGYFKGEISIWCRTSIRKLEQVLAAAGLKPAIDVQFKAARFSEVFKTKR